jgi:hypothetical protein
MSITKTPSLTFEAVIPNTGTPIGFAGGEGEAGFLKIQHYIEATQIEHLLRVRGAVLKEVISEGDQVSLLEMGS